MIVKNEECNLPRALASAARVADEIIVVDTGSTDSSISIAQSFGAIVHHYAWKDDFADARNASLSHATGDWVLVLDADEEISDAMVKRLPKVLRQAKADAYIVILANKHGDTVANRVPLVRLFRNHRGYRYEGTIHEHVERSITGKRGRILPEQLEIFHYGYNPLEDQRKGRRERNIRLLNQALTQEPEEHRLWFFLGVEHALCNDFPQAEACFRKAIALDPTSAVSATAAVTTAELLLRRGMTGEAWNMARLGLNQINTHWDALVRIAQAALRDGDYLTAADAVAQLRKAPDDGFGYIPRTQALLLDLDANVQWEAGHTQEALAAWRRILESDPNAYGSADRWVRQTVQIHGLRQGTIGAVKELRTPAVAAAAIGALLRAGETDLAADLTVAMDAKEFPSAYFLHGLAVKGDWAAAWKTASRLGMDGILHLAAAAVWHRADDIIQRVLPEVPDFWRTSLESVLQGTAVPSELQWTLEGWMALFASVGSLELFGRALPLLEGAGDRRLARAARLLFEAGLTDRALELALSSPSEPDALEVLGLIADRAGDASMAATFLSQRALLGPAPVRVYHRGAMAMRRLGNSAGASEMLQQGRLHRPLSKLLQRDI